MDDRSWKRMMFKGNKVWLAVDDKEEPIVRGNKFLIKYQLDQDHEYWVRQENVAPIDPSRLKKKSSTKPRNRGAVAVQAPEDLHGEWPPKTIIVFTDGASSGNPGPSGAGVVLRYGSREKEISKYIGITTNNVAELTAIKIALQAIRTPQFPVRLFTDSAYCFGLLSLGWKPKRNEKLVAAIKARMEAFKDLKILKVEGHAGIEDNERADRLARQGITAGTGQNGQDP